MDKIYSRKRIIFFKTDDKKTKKKIKIVLVFIVAMLTAIIVMQSISPMFETLCKEKALYIATEVVGEESSKVLKEYEYTDLVSVTKNEIDETNILKTNVVVINEIASDIAVKVIQKLEEKKTENVEIPIGALLGNKYLSGFGPNIKINIIPKGNIITDLKTEFETQGINQTIYRIYLDIKCNVNIVNAYNTIETQVTNQVLLVETVIVGGVPNTYYNLEGMDGEESLKLID